MAHECIHATVDNEMLHQKGVLLTNTVTTVLRLCEHRGCPVHLGKNHVMRRSKGNPHSCHFHRTYEYSTVVILLKLLYSILSFLGILVTCVDDGIAYPTVFGFMKEEFDTIHNPQPHILYFFFNTSTLSSFFVPILSYSSGCMGGGGEGGGFGIPPQTTKNVGGWGRLYR